MPPSFTDLRYAARAFRKEPAFALVVVVTLALAIGANTAMFSLFDAVLLQSLPVPEPDRLILFSDAAGEGTRTSSIVPDGRWELFSSASYEFLRAQPLPYDALAAVRSGETTVSVRMPGTQSDRGVQRAQAHLVSGTFFDVMGVQPALGRLLEPRDDRADAAPVAVVSDEYWRQRLGGDPAALGRVTTLNGTAFTIVGIMPPGFFGERVRRAPDFWVPLVFQPQVEQRPSLIDNGNAYWLGLIARLRGRATRAEAQTATNAALRQFLVDVSGSPLSAEQRRQIDATGVELVDGGRGISLLRLRYSRPLRMLLGVVALVLLIACANVGNLLLARAARRHSEISLRLALGATRSRLIAQLLTESAVLGVAGAAGGVLLASWVSNLLLGLVASSTTPVRASLSLSVLAFTSGVTCLAVFLFGLVPALQASRVDLVSALKAGRAAAMRRRLSQPLVAAQIGLSLVLLVGTSLFARSLINIQRQPLGFNRDNVLLARITPRMAGYTPETVADLYRRLHERLNAVPGVRRATIARYSPLGGGSSVNSGSIDGYVPAPNENVSLETILVGPDYPETLEIPVLLGRAITITDDAAAPPVAMVSQTFVRSYLRDTNPLGRHFQISGRDLEIVGVLADVQFRDARGAMRPVVYPAFLQDASQFALDSEIELRTAANDPAVFNLVRQAVAEIDANLPLSDPRSLGAQIASTFNTERLAARLVSVFSGLALLLAAVGLYGIVAHSVVRRTSEIGVRMALGANRTDVMWMILRETLTLLAIGVAAGMPIAAIASRIVRSQLYGVTPTDPLSFAGAASVLVAVAITTGLLPAGRAARIEPLVALRHE